MTQTTRIACPGCRTLLVYVPEALDFPGNCAECDCRFTTNLYIRVSCPSCQCGAKVRANYRNQRVRCARCQHGFVAEEGIPPAGGGLLLVARLLDSDSPTPPETIQPFFGVARPEPGPTQALPGEGPDPEVGRLRAERDRLTEEVALFKALLTRLVASPVGPDPSPPGSPGDGPGPDGALAEVAEERDRLELLCLGLRAELERAATGLDQARRLAEEARELASHHEGRFALATGELEAAEEENSLQAGALDQAIRDRSELQATIDRLNWAVQSAKAGEADALLRLGELAKGHEQSGDLLAAERDSERRRRLEFDGIVEGLKAEIEAARQAEARALAEHASATQGFELERLGLLDRLGLTKAEAEEAHQAELDRLRSELQAEAERGQLELLDLAAEVDRLRSGHEAEAERSAGLLATAKRLEEERRGWLDQAKRAGEQAEAVDRLLGENQTLDEQVIRLKAESRRMSAEVLRARPDADPAPATEALRLEKEQLAETLKSAVGEAERRQAALVVELRRVKQEYAKLADAKKALEEARPGSGPAAANGPNGPGGGRLSHPPIVASATVPTLADAVAASAQNEADHRDLAVGLLYDEPFEADRPGRSTDD